MRTTIDLPPDLHRLVKAIARDQGISSSEAVAMLLRRAIGTASGAEVLPSERTGLSVLRLGRTITDDDVRALDDEQ